MTALETMFLGIFRGWNNNPTLQQFKSIVQHLLYGCGVDISPNENISPQDSTTLFKAMDSVYEVEIFEEKTAGFSNLPSIGNFIVANVLEYIAGFFVKKVLLVLKCDTYRQHVVQEKPKGKTFHLLQLKNRGGLMVPADGVVKVIRLAEQAMRQTVDLTNATIVVKVEKIVIGVKCQVGI